MITEMNTRDVISMKLLHYLITKKNYTPMIVQGVENEIWLENLDEDYKIVRIVNNYIHNDEQMEFDVFKTKRMAKKVKRKTFTFNIRVLSILTDVGDNVDKEKEYDGVDIIYYEDDNKLVNNKYIKESFPDLANNLEYSEDGFQLFLKITNEINQKNMKVSMETDNILKPKVPVVTYVLLGIIVMIFLIIQTMDQNLVILKYGLQRDLVKMGEVYRLITAAFIHVDITHIIANAYSLFITGRLVESYFGKKKFSIIYFFSALTASLLSICMSESFSIGASGAIFGLLGSLLYFGFHYRVYFGNVLIRQIVPIIILNLGIGFIVPGIDNFAHIGGLIGGYLISRGMGVNSKDRKSDKINGLVLSFIYLAFLIILVVMREA